MAALAKRASDVMTQTNKLALRMILKISLRAKAGVPKTLVKQKLRLHYLYFPQNTLMLTESRGEFSHLHSIFKLRALRDWCISIYYFSNSLIIHVLMTQSACINWVKCMYFDIQ